MEKKIVIKLPVQLPKARSKAMKMASAVQGVISVSVKDDEELTVIGEYHETDPVCLVNELRKKFCFADLISVEEVKPPKPPPAKPPTPAPAPPQQPPPCPCPPPPIYVRWELDDSHPPSCSIS